MTPKKPKVEEYLFCGHKAKFGQPVLSAPRQAAGPGPRDKDELMKLVYAVAGKSVKTKKGKEPAE